jgi:hypothetical protein
MKTIRLASLLLCATSAALAVGCLGKVSGVAGDPPVATGDVVTPPDAGARGTVPPRPGDPDAGSPDGGPDAGWSDSSSPPASCLASAGTVGLLRATKTLASPTTNSTGITYDGVGLWILSGGQNAAKNRLVRFDPSTGTIDRSFSFQNLIEQLGTGAYGITWDGSSVWISISGNTNKLVTVDPTTGAITGTFGSPTILGPSDLDFDGQNLWLSSGTGSAYEIDRATGGVLDQFTLAASAGGRDNGIAAQSGAAWVGDLFGGLEVYDMASGTKKGNAVHADCTAFAENEVGPSVFIGGELVMLSDLGITYYEIAPAQ